MLQVDLIKPAEDIEATNVEPCIVESEEIFIEKPWIRRLPESSISYFHRCVDKRKVPEIKEKLLERPIKLDIIDIEYPYPYTKRHRARALDIVCVNTPRGIQCLSFKEALKLKYC